VPRQDQLLVSVMQWHLHREVDEYWGPLDPRVLPELRAAHAAAGMAVYLEAAAPGGESPCSTGWRTNRRNSVLR
jgi:hypothetical protein